MAKISNATVLKEIVIGKGRIMTSTVKVAAIQMNCFMDGKEKNLKLAGKLIDCAGTEGAALIVLPEFFSTAYRVEERDYELSEIIPGPTTDWMHNYCKKHNTFLIGAIIERDICDGVMYDTAVLVGPNGYIGKYRKVCLWGTEVLRFKSGSDYPVFDLGFAKVGIQICYEVGFPEGARILAQKGANLLAYTSAFGLKRTYVWDIATRARALENGVFVIDSNRYGLEKGETDFAGKSRIVNPQGTVLCEATEENEVIIAEINMDEVSEQRLALPYLRDYKKKLFVEKLSE